VFRPAAIPWRADVGWVLMVLLVAVAYVALLHVVPWFLVAIPIGRMIVMMWLSRRVWIAVTGDQLQVLEGSADVWSVPRAQVAAIHVGRRGASRVEFVDRTGAPLVTAPLMYSARQIARIGDVLAAPVIDHRK
jgi:hypothetical protein